MEKLCTSTLSCENKTRTREGNSGKICGVGRGEIVQCSLVKTALNDFEFFVTIMYNEGNALVLRNYVFLKFLSD